MRQSFPSRSRTGGGTGGDGLATGGLRSADRRIATFLIATKRHLAGTSSGFNSKTASCDCPAANFPTPQASCHPRLCPGSQKGVVSISYFAPPLQAHPMTDATKDLPDWGEMPSRPGLYLSLNHGRDFPQQTMRGRGFPGPKIGPLLYVRTQYGQELTLRFANRRDAKSRIHRRIGNLHERIAAEQAALLQTLGMHRRHCAM